MNFSLNVEQKTIREEILRFSKNCLNQNLVHRERQQSIPTSLWLECAKMGLCGLLVPEEFGGSGADAISTVAALEALGEGCEDGGLAFAIGAQLMACTVPIVLYGTQEQKQQFLPAICRGELVMANAMTESESGSDAFQMDTSAMPQGRYFVINGSKSFVSNVLESDFVLTYAKTKPETSLSEGLTAFIVSTGLKGLQKGRPLEKMGLRTCSLGEVHFDHVEVPGNYILGNKNKGGVIFHKSMIWERIGLSAIHIGTIQRLLNVTVSYARERQSKGRPIAKYQAIAHKLANMQVKLEAGRLLVYKAAARLDKGQDATMSASICKVYVSEELVQCSIDAIQTFGGYGFLTDYNIERVLRDSVAATLYSGTSEIQRNIIAGMLGL